MKVVIVAKTRMGSGACVGALTFDGRSLRLIAADREYNDQFNLEYEVGDVWDVDWTPDPEIVPPHVENIIVQTGRRLPRLDNLEQFIQTHFPPRAGGIDQLFDGLTQSTQAGALYIAARTGIPDYSTFFWQPDRTLQRDDQSGKRIRYRYPTADGGRTLTFVGFQEPPAELPAGSLLRVSLAHWWRPADMPDREEYRCYVQLSGWLLPPTPVAPQKAPSAPVLHRAATTPAVDDALIYRRLRSVFGYDQFRPLQEEIVRNLLAKRDTLAIMPTGSGKSLCYQLPSLLFGGLTVVVSPLIALMQDQVEQMHELGVPAVFLNSTLTIHEYVAVTEQVRRGAAKLLYAAPETLLRPETLLLLSQVTVDCLTIDEAHCISSWGHDFRPEYRQLVALRERLPTAAVLAVTATATQQVRDDIKQVLRIADADEFVASFDRENLFLRVQPRVNGLNQLLSFLADRRDQSGIIYCNTRRQTDQLHAELEQRSWSAVPYHAGLDDATRRRNQRRFLRDDVPIMVATIAFGMGINKSNVRFVVHFNLPKNIESYYQQIGRAGRDGLPADCLLLYGVQDVGNIRRFFDAMEPTLQRAAEAQLQALQRYVETHDCRRRPLLAYFDEIYGAEACGLCDNCQTERAAGPVEDVTIPAQKFLSCVIRTGEMFGTGYIIDVLRGSRQKRILENGHNRLSTWGIGREYSTQQWKLWAQQFIQQGLLAHDMTHGGLSLTQQAIEVLRGRRSVTVHAQSPSDAHVAAGEHDLILFDLLKGARRQLADAANVPPYVIFSDRTLLEMATYFPQTPAAFATVSGVGESKLERYADRFLPIIQSYAAEHGLAERIRPAAGSGNSSTRSAGRTLAVVEAYNAGQTVAELTTVWGVQESTILNHLWRYVQGGRSVRLDGLPAVSEAAAAAREQILAVFAHLGPEYLRPVYDALQETISYADLHILRLHFVASFADG